MNTQNMKERLAEIILERSFRYSDNSPFTLASGKKAIIILTANQQRWIRKA